MVKQLSIDTEVINAVLRFTQDLQRFQIRQANRSQSKATDRGTIIGFEEAQISCIQ